MGTISYDIYISIIFQNSKIIYLKSNEMPKAMMESKRTSEVPRSPVSEKKTLILNVKELIEQEHMPIILTNNDIYLCLIAYSNVYLVSRKLV